MPKEGDDGGKNKGTITLPGGNHKTVGAKKAAGEKRTWCFSGYQEGSAGSVWGGAFSRDSFILAIEGSVMKRIHTEKQASRTRNQGSPILTRNIKR